MERSSEISIRGTFSRSRGRGGNSRGRYQRGRGRGRGEGLPPKEPDKTGPKSENVARGDVTKATRPSGGDNRPNSGSNEREEALTIEPRPKKPPPAKRSEKAAAFRRATLRFYVDLSGSRG